VDNPQQTTVGRAGFYLALVPWAVLALMLLLRPG
jgi:hypothetical protein